MANLTFLQARLDALDQRITDINAEITTIDAESPSDQSIIDMLAARKTFLQTKLTEITNRKATVQAKYDAMAANAPSFTESQQTVVDSINTQFNLVYSAQMDDLKKRSDAEKTNFFTLYAAAENAFQQECAIKNFFSLD